MGVDLKRAGNEHAHFSGISSVRKLSDPRSSNNDQALDETDTVALTMANLTAFNVWLSLHMMIRAPWTQIWNSNPNNVCSTCVNKH